MQATLRVRRFDPESGKPPRFEAYTLDVPHYATVLDALIQIREEVDGSLALRCSCRSAICGSCAMRINGQARLACKTKILSLTSASGAVITVEPAGNMPVIKDLVVDMKPFWDKIRAIKPYLQPPPQVPEREYIVPNQAMLELAGVMDCIMCGACVSDCTVLEVDKKFLGPAALAKAYRFLGDPRDVATIERLKGYVEPGGVWDCTHCFYCVEVCPKGVAPMERILSIRKMAMDAGLTDNNGSRHASAFVESVRHSGWLNEATLLPKSIGFNIRELLRLIPGAIRLLIRRKMPSPIHPPIPKAEEVRQIFARLEEQRRGIAR